MAAPLAMLTVHIPHYGTRTVTRIRLTDTISYLGRLAAANECISSIDKIETQIYIWQYVINARLN